MSEKIPSAVDSVRAIMPCECHKGYTSRNLTDPTCAWHRFGEDIADTRAADRAAVANACAEIVTRMERPVLHGDGFTSVSGSAEAIRALAAKLARGEGHE